MSTPSIHDNAVALHSRIERLLTLDPFSAALGIQVVEAKPGRALLSMRVDAGKTNAAGICHGGVLWTLADMAFGAAAQYEGQIQTIGSDLTFLRPAPGGSLIRSAAKEVSRNGRTAVFHIVLSIGEDNDTNSVAAAGMFTGRWMSQR